MIGKIQYIKLDDQYGFRGAIITADGTRYSFNSKNWLNSELVFDDIATGTEVEFELKSPNQKGYVFPKQIRFKGETLAAQQQTGTFNTKHSHGEFKKFVYLKTAALIAPLTKLVEGFADQRLTTPNNIFRQIATAYNELEDPDFIFSFDNGQDIVLFPSGFLSKEGQCIYLYCVRNDEPDKSAWVCDRVFCNKHIVGGAVLHDLVNANWYEIVSNLKELLPDFSDDVKSMVQFIEARCMIADTALIWLKNGVLSTENNADHLYVPTGYVLEDGKELYLYCSKHKGVKGYGWYFDCITYENAPLDVYDKNAWLELWAEFDWENIYSQIVNQTLEERWSFGKRGDYGILRNYLIYTFAHQWKTSAVGFSADKKYAAFNTGLPDRNTYKYIYAFYEEIDNPSQIQVHPLHISPKYRFRSFVISDRGGDGKTLKTSIRPLPNPPQYFAARSSTVWELDFNDNNQVTMPGYDDIHILIQRCDRLPLDFYRYPASKSKRLQNILDSDVEDAQKFREIREFFMPIVDNEPDSEVTQVYRLLVDMLDNVISIAIKKLSWNWRAVVPCYNPEREESCFLLPVSFCDATKPNRAMIASAHEVDGEMIYAIHTVISLEWAYLDARLVCRPESEWLAADNIG